MNYGLSNEERETTINYNDAEDIGSVYTCNKALIRKLDGFCKKRPDLYKLIEKDPPSKTYTFPKKLVNFRLPRVLTQKNKERLSKMDFGRKVKIN